MNSLVPFECPGCQHLGRVHVDQLGARAICRHCDCALQLPKHLRLSCPSCQEVLRVGPQLLDQTVICRFCRGSFQATLDRALILSQVQRLDVPAPPPAADDPAPVLRAEIERLGREREERATAHQDELEQLRQALAARDRRIAEFDSISARLESEHQRLLALFESARAELLALDAHHQAEADQLRRQLAALEAERDRLLGTVATARDLAENPTPDPTSPGPEMSGSSYLDLVLDGWEADPDRPARDHTDDRPSTVEPRNVSARRFGPGYEHLGSFRRDAHSD